MNNEIDSISPSCAIGKPLDLTPLMQEVIDRMHSYCGTLTYYPGGYWCVQNSDGFILRPTYGKVTIEALVRRGLVEYCDWKQNRKSRYPVKAHLCQTF